MCDTCNSYKRGNSWLPSINKGLPSLISHDLFFVQGYSTQISLLLSILSHSSLSFFLLSLSFLKLGQVFVLACHLIKKYLEKLLALRVFLVSWIYIGGNLYLVLLSFAYRFSVGCPSKVFCLDRSIVVLP